MNTAHDAALAKIATDFNKTVGDAILGITNPLQLALNNFETAAATRLDEAKAAGADLVQVERLTSLERQQIIDKYAGQANASLGGVAKNVLDFIHQLTGTSSSPLANATALANAKTNYDQKLAFAKANPTDTAAQSEATSAAKDYLDLEKAMYASSSTFFAAFNSVVDDMNQLAAAASIAPVSSTGGITQAQAEAMDVIAKAQTPQAIAAAQAQAQAAAKAQAEAQAQAAREASKSVFEVIKDTVHKVTTAANDGSLTGDTKRTGTQGLPGDTASKRAGRQHRHLLAASTLPGFATGGSFDVGGEAGVDANIVAFRATRGERVTIGNGDSNAQLIVVLKQAVELLQRQVHLSAEIGADQVRQTVHVQNGSDGIRQLRQAIERQQAMLDRLAHAPRRRV